MVDYRENMKLHPKDNREYYLITITSDNVSNAGTIRDIYLQFRYLNMRDKETTTGELRLRDYVDQFYGTWPGNVSDFAYNYGLRTGGNGDATAGTGRTSGSSRGFRSGSSGPTAPGASAGRRSRRIGPAARS